MTRELTHADSDPAVHRMGTGVCQRETTDAQSTNAPYTNPRITVR